MTRIARGQDQSFYFNPRARSVLAGSPEWSAINSRKSTKDVLRPFVFVLLGIFVNDSFSCQVLGVVTQNCDSTATIDCFSLEKGPFYGSEGSEFESRRVHVLEQQAVASQILSQEGLLARPSLSHFSAIFEGYFMRHESAIF